MTSVRQMVTPRPLITLCSLENPYPDDKDKTVTVESKDGKTIYVIQNLYINLTAEVVHQLNMNPQEVINHYHELIQGEIEKNR